LFTIPIRTTGLTLTTFATARNTALEACSSEWCLWVDADDVMAEDGAKIVEEAIDQAIEKDAHLVALKYNVVQNAGLIPTPGGNFSRREELATGKTESTRCLLPKSRTRRLG
jgi:glycosyltransferase involved in cell wall biosynthesis